MKNRIVMIQQLLEMKENANCLDQSIYINNMIKKLKTEQVSYYEALNILSEVTHISLDTLEKNMLEDAYWNTMKQNSKEKEGILQHEYESIISTQITKNNKLDKNINEAYEHLLHNKKEKEKKLKNLDKTLIEILTN